MTVLYLVSALRTVDGRELGYWKVGITDRTDRNPLKRDRVHYQEVFRSVELDEDEARDKELMIARLFKAICDHGRIRQDCGRESLPYPFSFSTAANVFDFVVGLSFWPEPGNPLPLSFIKSDFTCIQAMNWSGLFSVNSPFSLSWRDVYPYGFFDNKGRLEYEGIDNEGMDQAWENRLPELLTLHLALKKTLGASRKDLTVTAPAQLSPMW